MTTHPLLIRQARIIDPDSDYDAMGDVLVEGEVIAAIGPTLPAPIGADIVEANGLALIPGLIDLRVSVGEPGAEHRETLGSAGRSAVAGGVTTIALTPDTTPVIDQAALIHHLTTQGKARSPARILAVGALTKGLNGEELAEIGLMAEAGAAFFSQAQAPILRASVVKRCLDYARGFDALVSLRPQDASLAAGGVMAQGELAGRLGLKGVPALAEWIGLDRDLALAMAGHSRFLVDQVSSAGSLPRLAAAKRANPLIAASVSINHLLLNCLDIGDYRTFAKLDPPLREESDRLALIDAVESGLIDIVVSAHDPRPPEEKRVPFDEAAFGSIGVETLLSGLLALVAEEALSLRAALSAVTCNPAKLLRAPFGRIAIGAPADLALVDLTAPIVVDLEHLRSRSRNCALDGRRLQGRVAATFVAGRKVFERH